MHIYPAVVFPDQSIPHRTSAHGGISRSGSSQGADHTGSLLGWLRGVKPQLLGQEGSTFLQEGPASQLWKEGSLPQELYFLLLVIGPGSPQPAGGWGGTGRDIGPSCVFSVFLFSLAVQLLALCLGGVGGSAARMRGGGKAAAACPQVPWDPVSSLDQGSPACVCRPQLLTSFSRHPPTHIPSRPTPVLGGGK